MSSWAESLIFAFISAFQAKNLFSCSNLILKYLKKPLLKTKNPRALLVGPLFTGLIYGIAFIVSKVCKKSNTAKDEPLLVQEDANGNEDTKSKTSYGTAWNKNLKSDISVF